jgi:hypothetical protein
MVIHGFVYPNNVPDAPSLDLAKVAQRIRSIAREFVELCRKGAPRCSEENFAQAVERVLQDEVRKPLGIAEPAHEYKIGFSKHYDRADAYYGLVVFEYKRRTRASRANASEGRRWSRSRGTSRACGTATRRRGGF